jgi:hypothetical protein
MAYKHCCTVYDNVVLLNVFSYQPSIHPSRYHVSFCAILSKNPSCYNGTRWLFVSWVVYGCLYLAILKSRQDICKVVILYMV